MCTASTGPISLTTVGSQPNTSRQRSTSARVLVGRVDVLGAPAVGARVVALARVVHHPLERARAGAHALHRRHLVLDGEDRLHPQRGPDPGAGRADPPAAAEELERVDREPQLAARPARSASARRSRPGAGPSRAAVRRGEHHEARARPRRWWSPTRATRSPPLPVALERLLGLARRPRACPTARRRCGPTRPRRRPPAAARTTRGEVADRGLRGGGQALGAAQLLEERVVVGDLRLGHRAVAAEHHVERHHVYRRAARAAPPGDRRCCP